MATPTRKEIAQAKSDAAERDSKEVFSAVRKAREHALAATSDELLTEIGKKLPAKRAARYIVEKMKSENVRESEFYYKLYFDMVKQRERNAVDLNETQISKLEDDQLEALLQLDYGLPKPANAEDAGGRGDLESALGSVESEVLEAVGESQSPLYEAQAVPRTGNAGGDEGREGGEGDDLDAGASG